VAPFDGGGSYGEAPLRQARAEVTCTVGLGRGSSAMAAKINGNKKHRSSLAQPSLKRNNGGGGNGGAEAYR
jgi:hypothetical protein